MSQAKLNQLASGFANATSNIGRGMVLGQTRVAPGERFARLERHELTDRLFQLFSDKPYWSISAIKQTLQQPDAWLREVLKDVAAPIKEGQYANMWELKENWKEGAGAKAEPKDEDDEDVDVDVDDLEAGPDEEMSDDEDEFEEV
jgi:transcription initiation factor TFIIF subunit beta